MLSRPKQAQIGIRAGFLAAFQPPSGPPGAIPRPFPNGLLGIRRQPSSILHSDRGSSRAGELHASGTSYVYFKETHMGEMILLTTIVGMVGATARMLYRHPIQWSEEAVGDGTAH